MGQGRRAGYTLDAGGIGMSALDRQEGGGHYKDMKIQPIEYIVENGLDWFQGNIVKYASRHKQKGGAADLRKVIHYAELALLMQYGDKDGKDGTWQRPLDIQEVRK